MDPTGHYLETALDVAFIVADVAAITSDPTNGWAWAALVADGVCTALPGATGGGAAVRGVKVGVGALKKAKVAEKVGSKLKKVTEAGKKFLADERGCLFPKTPKVHPNKLNHIFGKPGHKLDKLLDTFDGNQAEAYLALEKETQNYVTKNQINGLFKDIVVDVNGVKITVRGNVIDGQVEIGTAFIP